MTHEWIAWGFAVGAGAAAIIVGFAIVIVLGMIVVGFLRELIP